MTKKEFLVYIVGYLNGVNTSARVSSDKILKVKSLLKEYNEEFYKVVESSNVVTNNYEEYEDVDYDNSHNSIYNNPNYNPDLDLDQQGPDFDF